ncbi:MAG: GNAT family N-acetyltransferase [Actinobacteria bacterium]|nr:GNAT family N-acetyltransferase [Actinomycetota bacterium]MCL5883018.1 GNAT family N-acetyltransferase [Actinomycetota bacterium]
MIRLCSDIDFDSIYSIINDSARAYEGVIPEDCWQSPFMPLEELRDEIASHVVFWGYEEEGELVGVMGIQDAGDVTLIRHAYVRARSRNRGIGSQLLKELRQKTSKPILMGTWIDAVWAIRFYEKHGFKRLSAEESARLLRKYWSISERQIEASVVLAETPASL